ncbi:MAG: hypothetical protein V1696_03120 [Candidatus Jorgensenbacteria bacterium]
MTSLFRRRVFLLFVLLIIVSAIFWFYLRYFRFHTADTSQVPGNATTTEEINKVKHGPCLADDEMVEYDRISQHLLITQPKDMSPVIYVRNKTTGETTVSFRLDDVMVFGHPMEIHNCGVYVVRAFNYDPQKAKQEIGFRDELWKYDYRGEKKMLILLSEKPKEFIDYYGLEFRVAPTETYVSFIRGYLGKADYAIVIKDLNALRDILTLTIAEIEKRNPDLVQDIAFDDWTNDGRYFWVHTHYGANTLGFIRIDMETKTFDLFPAPKDVLGGDALNLEKGLITVHPGNVWFGIAQVEEQEKAKRRAQSIGTELYVENLFTHERQFVASTAEPLHYFKPKWISDTELEYSLPSGETKMYTIP